MAKKAELIEQLRQDLDNLVHTNEGLVRQLGELNRRETEMEKRLDSLLRKHERLEATVSQLKRKVGLSRR